MKVSVEFKEPKKMNIKKIIAREGLVIILFALLAFISFLIPSYLTTKDLKTPIDLLTQKKYEITVESGKIYTVILNKKNVKDVDEYVGVTKEAAKRGLLKSPKDFSETALIIVKEAVPLGNFKNGLFLGALLGYPLYLLIRFILWAIKTLKER
jgi:hypothetical protein